jgi:uncharacterized membrane protein YadS
MADTATASQARAVSLTGRVLRMLPGIGLLLAVGYGGKLIDRLTDALAAAHGVALPKGEYILWSILLGLVLANTMGVPRVFRAGVATYEFWLKLGIVLLGARFLFGEMMHLGGISLVLVAFEIVFSLVFMTLLGRSFGLRPKLISLLAIGSSVCGVSAILATCGVIGADDEE